LRQLHPGLVYVSITPFGQTSMYSSHRGGDLIAQATGGIMFANGDPTRRPAMAPYELGWHSYTCLHAAFGVLVALRARRTTGEGQHVDVSRQEVVLYCQGCYIPRYAMQYEIARREPLMSVGWGEYLPLPRRLCQCGPVYAASLYAPWCRMSCSIRCCPTRSGPPGKHAWNGRQVIDEYIAAYLATVERNPFVETAQRAGVPVIPVLGPDAFVEHPHNRGTCVLPHGRATRVGSYRLPVLRRSWGERPGVWTVLRHAWASTMTRSLEAYLSLWNSTSRPRYKQARVLPWDPRSVTCALLTSSPGLCRTTRDDVPRLLRGGSTQNRVG